MGKKRQLVFVEEPAKVEWRNGVVVWRMPDEVDFDVCAPLSVLLESIKRSTKLYNSVAESTGANIAKLEVRPKH